jgi:hypothetical protein
VRLTDRWFSAAFVNNAIKQPNGLYQYYAGKFDDRRRRAVPFGQAIGLILWCPCGYGKPEYPLKGGRPHVVLVVFADRGAPADFGPVSRNDSKVHPRWKVESGDALENLTLSPSIDIGTPSCWHGYIQNGEVR